MTKGTVLIGMSGGVDSSAAAYLLQQNGYSCVGCTMQLYCTPGTPANVDDARAVADSLGIPFHVFDFQKDSTVASLLISSTATKPVLLPTPASSATGI